MLACLYRPGLATMLMAVAMMLVGRASPVPDITPMLAKIGANAATYLAAFALAWQLSGRPDGIEALASTKRGLRHVLPAWVSSYQ